MSSVSLFHSVVYSHLSCKSHQNILCFHPLLHPNVIRDKLPISCQQWIARDIPVCPNRLYALSMKVSLQIDKPNNKQQQQDLITFQYEIQDNNKSFRHVIPSVLNDEYSVMKCTFFVPSDVTLINLICHIQNKSMLAYEMLVYMDQCILTLESMQDVQLSRRQPISQLRLSLTHNESAWWSSSADHLYLLHVPSVPLEYSFHLRNQLLTKTSNDHAFTPSFTYLFGTTSNSTQSQQHSVETCAKCFAHTNSSNKTLQLHKDEECIRNLWIEALTHASTFGYQSVMIVRDDIILHQHWFERMMALLNNMIKTFPVVLLGALHTSEHSTSLLKEPVYTSTNTNSSKHPNEHSQFGVLLRTPAIIQQTLHFLRSSDNNNNSLIQPLLVSRVWNHVSVAYPNVMVLHPQHSSQFQMLRKSIYLNRIAGHPLYWDYDKTYKDHTMLLARDNHHQSLFLRHPLYRSTLVHIVLFSNKPKALSLPQIIQSIQAQTYSHWRLHIISADDKKQQQQQQAGVIQSDKILYHVSVKNMLSHGQVSADDWLTFQSTSNRSVPTRLDHEIRAWMYASNLSTIMGCEANSSNNKSCHQKLDPDPTTMFNQVSTFVPFLSKYNDKTQTQDLSCQLMENINKNTVCISEIFTFV